MENLRESISRFEKKYVIKMFSAVFWIWRSRSFNLRTIGKKTGLYVFSHSSNKANEWLKPNHLIRQLKRGLKVRDIIYEGELQRLVDDIKDIIEKREIKRSNTL
jgi:hypothetical protein